MSLVLKNLDLSSAESLFENNRQIAHDLRSPLSALNFVSSLNPDLPEASRALLEMAIIRLKEIADGLDIS